MTRKSQNLLVNALLAAAAWAWQAVPAYGDGVYEPVPLKDGEQRLIDESRELNGYFARQSLLYGDARAVDFVADIGRSLAPPPADDYVEYRFFVLRDPSPNAFALPNGDIYMHTGMLARLTDTAQLAAILAHEVNHVAGHHGIVNFRSTNKKIVASMVLTGVLGGLGSVISTGLAASMYGFSRELEQEADDRAVGLLTMSPYDARALPEIYAVLAQDYEGITPRMPTIWSTHPQLEARAARTREQTAGAPDGLRETDQYDATMFAVRTMTIRDYIQDDYPRTALALAQTLAGRYPEQVELAMLVGDSWAAMGALSEIDEQELSNRERARNANRRVMRTRQEREAALLKTPEGHAALRSNLGEARAAYEHALALDASFAPAHRGLGQVAERLGEPRAAAAAYVEYLRKAPDATDRTLIVERLRTLRDQLRTEGTGNVATTSD